MGVSQRISRLLARTMIGSLAPLLLTASLLAQNACRPLSQDKGKAMEKGSTPAFEVATIKPASSNEESGNIRIGRDRVYIENKSLEDLVSLAFGIYRKQIFGLPDNAGNRRYDIQGTTNLDHSPNLPEVQLILQGLLKNRFSLSSHWDSRQMPIYALTIAGDETHLIPHSGHASDVPSQVGGGSTADSITKRFINNTMDDFAFGLQAYLDRPVVNRTGLKGRYDFTLTWARDNSPVAVDAPSLSTALKEELNLKLHATKGYAKVLVIDRIDAPTPN